MQNAYAEVTNLLGEYFDGLYFSDTARLKRVFHPQAHYVTVTDGSLTYRTMVEYFPIVEKRESPAIRGEPRKDHIDSIEFAGPVTAFARVRCSIGEKDFTDLLTLINLDGRWRIVSKVFHFDTRA